jgi:multiple sugar transport system ATP-binding protein
MVFQNYALYPHMTVYKNMAFALKLRKFPKKEIDERVRHTANLLGIGELLDRKPKALSGGQRQRVAVGRAIVRQPQVFLFDEPLSNLDAKLRVETRAELKALQRRLETTTIYVTHDQEEAMTLGQRIVVMKDALVQQIGTPLEVYGRPANRFVGEFVGTPPMNMLTGRLLWENEGIYFDEGTAKVRLADRLKDALGPQVDQEVIMGVRPEAMSMRGEGRFAGQDNVLPLTVKVVEPLGEKMDLYASTEKHPQLVARIDAETGLEPGQTVGISLDMDRVHIFESNEEGKNLSLG